MAYTECSKHGGDVAVMVSPQILHVVEHTDELHARTEAVLLWIPIAPGIDFPFYSFENEFPEITAMKAENDDSEATEQKMHLLSLTMPACRWCFDEHFQ